MEFHHKRQLSAAQNSSLFLSGGNKKIRNIRAVFFFLLLLALSLINAACTGKNRSLKKDITEPTILFIFQPMGYDYPLRTVMLKEVRRLGYSVKSLPFFDDSVSYGTGFFISETGLFLTNYHVIEEAGTISLKKRDGSILPAIVLVDDPYNDIAILAPVQETKVKNWLTLGNSEREIIGERIKVLGYPFPKLHKDPTLALGVISSNSGFSGDPAKFQISAPIQIGNSGSPILNQKNEVVGIVNERIDGAEMIHETGPLPADVGSGVKAEYAASLLSILDINDNVTHASAPVSLSKAMDSTALVLENANNLLGDIWLPEQGFLVLVEFSWIMSFDLIYYTVIDINHNWTERSTAEIKYTGTIAGSPFSSHLEITRVTIDEILKKIGKTGS